MAQELLVTPTEPRHRADGALVRVVVTGVHGRRDNVAGVCEGKGQIRMAAEPAAVAVRDHYQR